LNNLPSSGWRRRTSLPLPENQGGGIRQLANEDGYLKHSIIIFFRFYIKEINTVSCNRGTLNLICMSVIMESNNE